MELRSGSRVMTFAPRRLASAMALPRAGLPTSGFTPSMTMHRVFGLTLKIGCQPKIASDTIALGPQQIGDTPKMLGEPKRLMKRVSYSLCVQSSPFEDATVSGPNSRRASSSRAAISSRARPQLMRVQRFSPLLPALLRGYFSRLGP